MISSKKNKTYLILIALLAVFVLNFIFPQYINSFLSFLSPKISFIPVLNQITSFPARPFRLGLDLQGGSRLLYEADLSSVEGIENQAEAMQGLRDVIERRVNLFGVAEPQVAVEKQGESYRLAVELPGIKSLDDAIAMIGKTPYLEFREEPNDATAYDENTLAIDYFQPTGLTGQYLKRAAVVFNQTTNAAEVSLEFNDEGAALFEEITSRNVGKQLAIFIDNNLISAPRVDTAISGGKAQITGSFTAAEAKELARNLNAGALPVPITLISQNTVGPTLGAASLKASLVAGILGLIGICLFMLIFYRLSGFLSSIALLLYILIVLSLFKLIPITLTLAGVGGAILSVGMAVDANILIFERFKEERQKTDNFEKALEAAFSRAWPSIRDSNFTTLLIALIMFGFGSSFVKGFAVALSLGILISMFSALTVTKNLMRAFSKTKLTAVKWLW